MGFNSAFKGLKMQFEPRSKHMYCFKNKSVNAAYKNNLYYILKTVENI